MTAEALTDEESDALEMDLPVNPPGVPVRQAKGGTLANYGIDHFRFRLSLGCGLGLAIPIYPSRALDRRQHLWRARLSDFLPLRLRGADHVQLPAGSHGQ